MNTRNKETLVPGVGKLYYPGFLQKLIKLR